MVHVWSINSGERFQGHHGPLVYQHCTFRALSCINQAARKIPLERNRAADFRVPVQFIQQFSVSFIHLQSSEKKSFHDRIITAFF